MFKHKILLSVMLTTFILIFNCTSAYAYNLCGYEWRSSSIKYYYDNYPSYRFKSTIGQAASAWNSESINASLSFQYPDGVYCAEVTSPNATWDGICYIYWDDEGYVTSATLALNSAISQTWDDSGALKSVAVHEFGHILSLDENGTLECIMNDCTWGVNSRYGTYGLTTPQSIDVAGVNMIYD
jgi:YD repeat-containing protein